MPTSTITGFASGPTSSGLLTWHAANLACGHRHFSEGWNIPHTGKAGDVVECAECARHAERIEWLRNLAEPVFRARYSERWGGQYHLYRRDTTSPTGVMLIGTVPATPAIDEVLRQKRISPLSPTEERVR